MTKFEMLRSLPPSETAREPVRTVAELQKRIEELQPQRQIEEALSQLRSGLQSQQSEYLTSLRCQTEEALSQLRSGLESQQSQQQASLDRTEKQHRSLLQALEALQTQRETQLQSLFKALETLTEQARTALDDIQGTAALYEQETAAHWQAQTQDLTTAIRLMGAERQRLTEAAGKAEQAALSVRDWTWRGWILAVMIAALVGLVTGVMSMEAWSRYRLQPQLSQMSRQLDQVLEQTQTAPTPAPRKAGKKP